MNRAAPSDWRRPLAITRSVLSGVAAGASACLSKHAGLEGALVIAALAATYAGTLQLMNKEFLSWLANRRWLSTQAPASPAQRAPLHVGLAKRGVASSFYAIMMSVGFYALGLNADLFTLAAGGRMVTMVLLSLYVQSAWQALNQEATQAAVRDRPAREHVYRRRSGIATLVHAMTIVVGSALNVGGSPLGPVLSCCVGTSGTLAYLLYRAGGVAGLRSFLARRRVEAELTALTS